MTSGCLIVICFLFIKTKALLPKWEATYQMNSSTIIYACNYSGYFAHEILPLISKFGIISIGGQNARDLWAQDQPMTCQQSLINQAETIKNYNPSPRLFIYRNLGKALPWYVDIRNKILDPNYSKWFLKFKPSPPYNKQPCTNNTFSDKCSMFYHDEGHQTPRYPAICNKDCDCGNGLPCGEYLYDHRNESVREWLINVFIVNSSNNTGLLNDVIDGYYIDDGWTDHGDGSTKACNTYNTFGGASEEDYMCVQDMGLAENDVHNIYEAWRQTMNETNNKIIELNGFEWKLFQEVVKPFDKSSCIEWLTNSGNDFINEPLLYKWTYSAMSNLTWTQFEIDLATFLLIRGDYGWIGYPWNGCHSDWNYQWSNMLDKDYGKPMNKLNEISKGLFQRKYTKCTVSLNCNTFNASFDFV